MKLEPLRRDCWLFCTAVFAMLWVIGRACVQSITIDEADTYLMWVARPDPSHWTPAANNHVLNSLLMRLFTSVFGLSHLTVRAPALIGAVIYIFAAYFLCLLITRDRLLEWPLFVCFVFNPLVLDYLVAARGYGLAMAFLTCAITVPAYCHLEGLNGRFRSSTKACVMSSICFALSFAANFSFAFVNAAALLLIIIWTWRSQPKSGLAERRRYKVRSLTACLLPGFLVTVFISGWTLLKWPKGQLWFGATSLRETLASVLEASAFRLNPQIVNPLLYPFGQRFKFVLFAVLGAIVLWRLVLLWRDRSRPRDAGTTWLLSLGVVAGGAAGLALLVHWLSFRLFHLLLPKDRTALYLIPLGMLVIGVIAAIPLSSRIGRWCYRSVVCALFAVACYFLLCLRLTYFKEWSWGADVKSVYSVLAYYNHNYCIDKVASSWHYVAALNVYRELSGRETIAQFTSAPAYPSGRAVYILSYPFDEGFAVAEKLKVVYRGDLSGVVVAVRPEALVRPAAPCSAGMSRGAGLVSDAQ